MQQITRVPKVEHFLKGVINIRGEIVPVMSIRLKMGIEEDNITSKSRIIILRLESGDLIGIIVDQVNQVLRFIVTGETAEGDTEEEGGCGGSCASCGGGCHHLH